MDYARRFPAPVAPSTGLPPLYAFGRFTLTLIAAAAMQACFSRAAAPEQPIPFREYIRQSTVPRAVLDRWLGGSDTWARFDPELGYVLGNSLLPFGQGGRRTIGTTGVTGARTSFVYPGVRPRINAYGDSYTECAQVNDAETWEEVLGGHLGEPIRNFGVGGYGVFQAYRRMLREERSDHGASHVILYIYGDDSIRSLLPYRRGMFYRVWRELDGKPFHGNFWAHLELDLETGRFVEKENPLTTKASLYRMTDADWLEEQLGDNLAMQLYAFAKGLTSDLDRDKVTKLAARLDFPFDWNDGARNPADPNGANVSRLRAEAFALLNRYGQHATIHILDRAREFVRKHDRKLLVVLNFTARLHEGGPRRDQEIVDYLARESFDTFDMNEASLRCHRDARTSLSYEAWEAQFHVNGTGHYNAAGNQFFARMILERVEAWLDPKPVTLRQPGTQGIDFTGYLKDSR